MCNTPICTTSASLISRRGKRSPVATVPLSKRKSAKQKTKNMLQLQQNGMVHKEEDTKTEKKHDVINKEKNS